MARAALGGFSVVDRGNVAPSIWCTIKPGATVYMGGIVAIDHSALDEGIVNLPQASGGDNASNLDVPLGIAVGNNAYNPSYSSTYKCEYITAAAAAGPHSNTTDYRNVEGPWSKGDSTSRAMVKVELIRPGDIIRGPLFNAAVGTAPSVLTVTTGNTDGLQMVTNATQFTPVANLCTAYCRSGNNAGCYRITDDTSTTTATWDYAMPNDVAIGDTFVRVPLRTFGESYVQIGATSSNYIDVSASPATNYFIINVVRLDLSEAGSEFVDFMFDVDNFSIYNRGWTAES